tara:strand:+ start:1076 stop:1576 length:501 start_codon:yes stop_codon:yes gene_type:complete
MKLVSLIQQLEQIEQNKISKFCKIIDKYNEIAIIGNGGSNAIASHISQDYTKKLGKKAFCFSDPSRLTCYINDYGMEKAYAQYLSEFCSNDCLVILVSSSGESVNILKCAEHCLENGIEYIILTGFEPNNTLREMYGAKSELEMWIDSDCYGVVECAHQSFLHTPC